MSTAIVFNPAHASHDEPRHVERAARMHAITALLNTNGLLADLVQLAARPASEAEIGAVHQARLLETLQLSAAQERLWIDHDTYTTHASQSAAALAAGAAIVAVQAVADQQVNNAFAVIRPPGHHATSARSMGFCLINHIAIAARYAMQTLGYARVAIVDYDVHHGNGTQDIFYDDPNVLFISTHASPLYPGTGSEQEIGNGAGLGTTLNLPVPYGTGDRGFADLYDQLVLPALSRFEPELILVSAGYDGHWNDPLGPLACSVSGYAQLTQKLMALAEQTCQGRIVLSLEGGYNEEALANCVNASLEVLLGREPSADLIGPAGTREPDLAALILRTQKQHPLFR
jgi:acetoin utilization deacetylase AcuC-like enzyme